MEKAYHTNKTFEKADFTRSVLPAGEYENCAFINCDFSNTNLSGFSFTECTFKDCNLSLAKLNNTALRNISFDSCKLLGLHFHLCNPFLLEVRFERCVLNLSSFYKLKLKNTIFNNSSLHEVDFTEADLSQAVFNTCDLSRTVFHHTLLEKADFRTAFNYSIDPEINRMKQAKFSLNGITGLLHKYNLEIE